MNDAHGKLGTIALPRLRACILNALTNTRSFGRHPAPFFHLYTHTRERFSFEVLNIFRNTQRFIALVPVKFPRFALYEYLRVPQTNIDEGIDYFNTSCYVGLF